VILLAPTHEVYQVNALLGEDQNQLVEFREMANLVEEFLDFKGVSED
jgi:hypothetical protein